MTIITTPANTSGQVILTGTNQNDVINAYDYADVRQTHVYAGGGDDTINMYFGEGDVYHSAWIHQSKKYQGHHVRGGAGEDDFNFRSLSSVTGTVIGRIEDFDASRDKIMIEGTQITNAELALGFGQTNGYNWKIVEWNGDHNDPDSTPQQWLLIDTNGGWVFYSLEGARVDVTGDGTANGGAQEGHFFTTEPPNFASMQSVGYVDPVNVVPQQSDGSDYLPSNGGILINDVDTTGSDVAEVIQGSNGNDVIAAGLNNDTVSAGSGNDRIWGGSGNDILNGGSGNDTLNGGTGNDTASYDQSSSAVNVFLNTYFGTNSGGDANGDVLISIENITGSAFNDILSGNEVGNVLIGLEGNDTIYGRWGDDTLIGGSGNDTLDGGTGNDTASYDQSSSAVNVFLNTYFGTNSGGDANGDVLISIENITGSAFNDILSGNGVGNVLIGLEGNDIMYGRWGGDTLIGGAGNDTLDGGHGNDHLYDGNGNDRLFGGSGNDYLYFGTGASSHSGGGSDKAYGGDGADQFIFSGTSGFTSIMDFQDGVDMIHFNGLDVDGMSDLTITDQPWRNSVKIEYDGGVIRIENMSASDISVDDFIF